MDYNKIKNILETEVLFENIKLTIEQMFSSIELTDKLKKYIQTELDWARSTFIRNNKTNRDGVIWYMRYVKYQVIMDSTIDDSQAIKYLKNILYKSDSTNIQSLTAYANNINGLLSPTAKTKMKHFLSLDIDKIQKYEFGWKTITDVWNDLEKYEDEWADRQNELIPVEEDDEDLIILSMNNNFYWLNLDTAYCPKEAKAMGHCGNSPRSGSDDTIYSLRKKIIGGNKKEFWKPYATFILNSMGFLTEMKGRFNEKPEEELHQYIIQLLLYPSIKGISGGGYLPENNFSMEDLKPNVSRQLIDEKPPLEGLMGLYKIKGASDDFMKLLNVFINDIDLMLTIQSYKTGEYNNTLLYFDSYKSVEQFSEYHDIVELNRYLKIYDKINTVIIDGVDGLNNIDDVDANPYNHYNDKENLSLDVVEKMPPKYIIEILSNMGHNVDKLTRQDMRDASLYLLENRSKYADLYLEAISKSIHNIDINTNNFNKYKKMIMGDMKTILEHIYMRAQNVFMIITEKEDDFEIDVAMTLHDLVNIITYGTDESDYETFDQLNTLKEYGPDVIDEYSIEVLHDMTTGFGLNSKHSFEDALNIYEDLFNNITINVEYDVHSIVNKFTELMRHELRESNHQSYLNRLRILTGMK